MSICMMANDDCLFLKKKRIMATVSMIEIYKEIH